MGLLNLNLPIVDTAGILSEIEIPRVANDEAQTVGLAIQHFRERGYRHFAYFSDSLHVAPPSRREEFAKALKAAGWPCSFPPKRRKSDPFSRRFHSEVVDWLSHLPRPTAILAANDVIAEWLVDLCRIQKIRVPEDLAILGVGNDEFFCLDNFPNISSIELPGRRIGYEAAKLLHRMMKNPRSSLKFPCQLIPATHIVTRHSTDAYALEHPVMASALRYIREHVTEAFSVADVARAVGCSRRLLEIQCRKTTQRTLLEQIHRIRVEHAKIVLEGTDLKVEAVAQASGFTDALHLRRAFQKYAGSCPAAYRKSHSPTHGMFTP
jgi:LacI family transcriptional regulator